MSKKLLTFAPERSIIYPYRRTSAPPTILRRGGRMGMMDISINRMFRNGTWEHNLTVRTDDADFFAALVKVVDTATAEPLPTEPVHEESYADAPCTAVCGGEVLPPPQEMTPEQFDELNRRIAEVSGLTQTPKPEPKKVMLRDARRFCGKTSSELAKTFGVAQQTWLLWERAPQKVALSRRPQIAKAVGYDVDRIDWQDHHVQVYPQGTDGGGERS